MEAGLNIQLGGMIGKHLAIAELARRGILATLFMGNVPDIDIRGYANQIAVPIRVKTITGDFCQLEIGKFLSIRIADNRQKVLGLNLRLI